MPFRKSRTSRGSRGRGDRPLAKKYQLIVLGVACACICLSCVVLVVSCYVYFSGTSPQIKSASGFTSPPITCVDCELLGVQKDDPLLKKLTTAEENGVEKCCAFRSEQMSVLLELSMRRQEENIALPEFNASDFKFSHVSAHKRLYPPPEDINFKGQKPNFVEEPFIKCRFLEEDDHVREHVRGVELQKDGIRIVKDGLYFVYSSVEFRPDSNYPCKTFDYKTWEYYVKRMPNSQSERPQNLLQAVHTCCDECTKEDETSFSSGVFYLQSGDVIHIEIQAHGLVRFRNDTSFAGLMMLGGGNPSGSDGTRNDKR